jgi:peptidoglycan/xylan/chitin deacetylase (PgdA/CDA1 family)
LADWFNVLPLDEAAARLADGSLPARACCITFDDGYADNLRIATPILKRHGLSATFFVATGFLNGGRMWNDTVIEALRATRQPRLALEGVGDFEIDDVSSRRRAVDAIIGKIKYLPVDERLRVTEQLAETLAVAPPTDLMMNPGDVRRLRGEGMLIGAHTVSHPILAGLPYDEARREIADSRGFLEELLGERIGLFAYPNGRPGSDYLPEHAELARELGFDAAVSTAWGAAGGDTDRFQIPRFTPWDRSRLGFGLRLARNLAGAAPQ